MLSKDKLEGAAGMGKSQILFLLTKPKWMPLWLHRWRERRAWLRWGKDQPVIFPLPTLNPSDVFIPTHNNIAAPRPWPKKEDENAE